MNHGTYLIWSKYDKTIKSIDKNEKKESVIHTRFSYNNVMFEAQEIRFYETVHQKTFQVSIIDSIEDKIRRCQKRITIKRCNGKNKG